MGDSERKITNNSVNLIISDVPQENDTNKLLEFYANEFVD